MERKAEKEYISCLPKRLRLREIGRMTSWKERLFTPVMGRNMMPYIERAGWSPKNRYDPQKPTFIFESYEFRLFWLTISLSDFL